MSFFFSTHIKYKTYSIVIETETLGKSNGKGNVGKFQSGNFGSSGNLGKSKGSFGGNGILGNFGNGQLGNAGIW